MLGIRLQRTGRKGHAQFRVVVQDSRRTPTSGKIVAQVGTYDPHSKTIILSKERAEHYLTHGAQPSDRVVRLFKADGIKLPDWVNDPTHKTGKIRSPEKLRRNRPTEEAPVEEAPAETAEASETPAAEETAPEA
jgi:small subunit ribosomal protein S16